MFLCLALSTILRAETRPATGRIYVADVEKIAKYLGNPEGPIIQLAKQMVLKAEGADISTGPASSVSLLLSNGSSLACGENVRLQVTKFSQAAMQRPRSNLDKENSSSQVIILIQSGRVAITTPELAPGSSQVVLTPQGQLNLRNSQMVIEVASDQSVVSVVSGNLTARTHSLDGGVLLESGNQAVLRNSVSLQPMPVIMTAIKTEVMPDISYLVDVSVMARQSVTFAPVSGSDTGSRTATVTPFDQTEPVPQELEPVKLVPVALPVQYTVSPARVGP